MIRARQGMAESWIYPIVLLIVAVLVLTPLVMVVYGSFRDNPPGRPGNFTLQNYAQLLAPSALQSLSNTLKISVTVALASTVLGIALAFLLHRTNIPGRGFLSLALRVTYYFPAFLLAMAWSLLASPRAGILNTALRSLIDGFPGLNIYSLGGIIWVMTLSYVPYVYMFCSGPFQSMDPSLEEAAAVSGASRWTVFRKITLPLAAYAVFSGFLLTFVLSAGAFGVPAILGTPAQVWVLATDIWAKTRFSPANYGMAGALSMQLLLLTVIGIALQKFVIERRQYTAVTGKAYRPRVVDLGTWRWLGFAFVGLYLLLALVLPLATLVYTSLLRFFLPNPFQVTYTLINYQRLLDNPVVLRAFRNSLILGFGGATLAMILAGLVAYLVIKGKLGGLQRRVLDLLAIIPVGVPGLVLGTGLLWAYMPLPIPIYGTIAILFISFTTNFLPYGVRAASSTLVQLDDSLEESAWVSGAKWHQALLRILMPLAAPGLVSGWMLLFVAFIKEISIAVLLYSYGSEVVSIMIWDLYDQAQWGGASALGVIMTICVFVAFFLAQTIGGRMQRNLAVE